jgi:hypothetical protein
MSTVLKLHAYLAGCENRAFRFGEFDCCLFVADWIVAAKGVDLAANERGTYSTFKQGLKVIKTDIKTVFKARLNHAEIATSFAKRGDIALCDVNGDTVAGIVGLGCVHCVAEIGLTTLPVDDIVAIYALESIHG